MVFHFGDLYGHAHGGNCGALSYRAKEGQNMIREFHESDTMEVMEIWLAGNKDAHPFIPKEYWISNQEAVQKQLLQAEVYVYETEGIIHGFIGIQKDHIAGIFVKGEYRCAGIGKHLLDYVKEKHPFLTLNVYQKNRRAVKFYKRERFSVISKDKDADSGEADETMRWQR